MKYLDIPTSDSHIHLFWNMSLEKREQQLYRLMNELNYDTVTILTIPYNATRLTKCRDFTENLTAFYIKHKNPDRVYAFAGLTPHHEEEKNTPEFFAEQAAFYMSAGFDGIKMIEGRPRQRHITGGYNDPKYQLLYKYCEENEIPMVMHASAPEYSWEENSTNRKELGVVGTALSWLDYYNELVEVLEKYPKLRLTLAHFLFGSERAELMAALLDRFENVYLDVCPNQFMFMDFGKKPEIWKPFFEKYQDRIIYGTDLGSNTIDVDGSEAVELRHMVKGFFEEKGPYTSLSYPIIPINMDESILRKIYKENMLAFYKGKAPKKTNLSIMKKELDLVRGKYFTFLDVRDVENMKLIESIF